MPYRVYLIVNAADRRYIGLSDDVERRVRDHNAGMSKWTRSRVPWKLRWTSREFSSLGEARKLENLLKRQKGGAGLDAILSENKGANLGGS
jgi:predicted GIY-YIG superfamily endonuclease